MTYEEVSGTIQTEEAATVMRVQPTVAASALECDFTQARRSVSKSFIFQLAGTDWTWTRVAAEAGFWSSGCRLT